MEESFVDLLQSLTNESEKITGVRLAELSDLDSNQLEQFAAVWKLLPQERRQTILEELGLMADAQIELSFESINRMSLDDPDPSVRLQAIENLWESEDPRLALRFVEILGKDPASDVRAAAGKALGTFVLIGETRNLEKELKLSIEEALLGAVRDDSGEEVQTQCLQSLGYSSRPEVTPLIGRAFKDADNDATVTAALRAMARSANPIWEESVLPRLNDPSPRIRLEAARAAGDIGLREAVPDLVDLLDDVDEGVRRAAIWALSQIGGAKSAAALSAIEEQDLEESEIELLHDAIDNLAFLEGARDLLEPDPNNPQDLIA